MFTNRALLQTELEFPNDLCADILYVFYEYIKIQYIHMTHTSTSTRIIYSYATPTYSSPLFRSFKYLCCFLKCQNVASMHFMFF